MPMAMLERGQDCGGSGDEHIDRDAAPARTGTMPVYEE